MTINHYDAPAAPKIPKAFQVGPNSLLTALADCKRNHDLVHIRAKEEVERRAFMKQVWQMEQAELKKSKANKKASKAKQKMEQHRGKTLTVKEKPSKEAFKELRKANSEAYNTQDQR